MIRIIEGDCRVVLPTLAWGSVHCVVTSPPYFGLRDYGVAGQLGLEGSVEEYVGGLVGVFREVWRVLRDDGTVWINLGDGYCAAAPGNKTLGVSAASTLNGVNSQRYRETLAQGHATKRDTSKIAGLKPKDLMMVPARVALALQADGWWLRSEIVWAKPNPMPESVLDRPTQSHEKVFLLAKSSRYFFDAEAVRERAESDRPDMRLKGVRTGDAYLQQGPLADNSRPNAPRSRPRSAELDTSAVDTSSRNIRNVWTIATAPYAEAHFATFPPALAERCVRAGTSERGCCAGCAAPWVRVVERTVLPPPDRINNNPFKHDTMTSHGEGAHTLRNIVQNETTGWEPSCACGCAETVPAVVLDPFGGAGTVGLVADRLGRDAVLIELNPAYCEMARRRIEVDCPLFAEVC
jgi:DNA modification methylase